MTKLGVAVRFAAIILICRAVEVIVPPPWSASIGLAVGLGAWVGMRYAQTNRPPEPVRHRCTAIPGFNQVPLDVAHRETLQCVEWAGHTPYTKDSHHNFGGLGPFTPGMGIVPAPPRSNDAQT